MNCLRRYYRGIPVDRTGLPWQACVLAAVISLNLGLSGSNAQTVSATTGAVLEIKASVLDLRPQVMDIGSGIKEVSGGPKGIGENAKDVQAKVVDLQLKETKTEVKIELSGDILFDFDKWDILPRAEPTLKQVAEVIQKYPRAKVLIEGHTDSKGADNYNLRLSQQRADSVKQWLVDTAEIDSAAFATKGSGEAKPKVANTNPDGSDNPENRQQNRRVEITVKKG